MYISTCRTSGSVWYRRRVVSLSCTFQRAVLAALRGAESIYGNNVYQYVCLFVSLNLVYLLINVKLGFVVGMTKHISDVKEVDIVIC